MKIFCYQGVSRSKQLGANFVLLCATLTLLCSSIAMAGDLRPFNAKYVAFRSGNDIGYAFLQLQSDPLSDAQTLSKLAISANSADKPVPSPKRYALTYQSKVKRFFLSDKRFEKTYFLEDANTLVPLSYEYKRTGTGPNKALKVEFNAHDQQIIIDETETLDWEGEFDNQLFRIDLPKKLAQGVTKTEYDFINYRGEKRHYKLEVVATEKVSLPYGQLMAFKVKINRESNSRVSYAWFAPSLNHNLVRLQQFKDGKEQGDMQLSKFSYL